MKRLCLPLILFTVSITPSTPAAAATLNGMWSASVTVNGVQIPFRMEFSGSDANPRGSFFNGDEKITSTSGKIDNGSVLLMFDHYGSKLQATLKDGVLNGSYIRAGSATYPFHAEPLKKAAAPAGPIPSINGEWIIPTSSPKGEKAWHLIVRQRGADVSAAILRIDGDTGTLTGSYKDGSFVLSHFSGARPALLVLTPTKDGLDLLQNGKIRMTAVRTSQAKALGLPAPDDPMGHTSVKDPNKPLQFSFPDLNGHIVSNTDANLQGKVVILAIGGSWCPNCHDEAPFLEDLYREYHSRGLEVIDVFFEEADQLKDPERLRAFIKHYGITYPVLLAGEPSELNAKIPEGVNLNAWPTTFFIGRNGLVKAAHTGFAAKASGPMHDEMVSEIRATIEKLLAEQVSAKK